MTNIFNTLNSENLDQIVLDSIGVRDFDAVIDSTYDSDEGVVEVWEVVPKAYGIYYEDETTFGDERILHGVVIGDKDRAWRKVEKLNKELDKDISGSYIITKIDVI